jgi:hypothetical protein
VQEKMVAIQFIDANGGTNPDQCHIFTSEKTDSQDRTDQLLSSHLYGSLWTVWRERGSTWFAAHHQLLFKAYKTCQTGCFSFLNSYFKFYEWKPGQFHQLSRQFYFFNIFEFQLTDFLQTTETSPDQF